MPSNGPGPAAAIAVLGLAAAGLLAAALVGRDAHPVVLVLLPQLVLAALVAMAARRWGLAGCGLGPAWPRDYGMALVAAPLLVGAALGLNVLVIAVLGQPQGSARHVEEVLTRLDTLGGPVVLVALAAVLPGVVEEALLRGVVLTGLRRRLPAWLAVVATALAFAALHWSPWRFLPQLALGLAAGWLAVRAGSCWPSAVLHAVYNTLVLMTMLIGQGRT